MALQRFFLTAISAIPVGLAAQPLQEQIAKCSVVVGNLERLDCYDQLARRNQSVRPQAKEAIPDGVGKWKIRDSRNPLDDTRTVALILDSDTGKPRFGDDISLVLRCKSKKTQIYINWSDFLGTDSAQVTYRIGSDKATVSDWGLSSDNKASFYPGEPVAFINALLRQNILVAQVTPYSESPLTATFDLTGLANAVKPLREACGW